MKNVYLKSAFRQPFRTVFLALLIGLATFALISRWTEYIVVRQETARLEADYRPIGVLGYRGGLAAGVRDGAEIVSGSGFVRFEDRRRFAQGVTGYTGGTGTMLGTGFMDSEDLARAGIFPLDTYFYATLTGLDVMERSIFTQLETGWVTQIVQMVAVVLTVDELAAGFVNLAPPTRQIHLLIPANDTAINARDMRDITNGRFDLELYRGLAEVNTYAEEEISIPFGRIIMRPGDTVNTDGTISRTIERHIPVLNIDLEIGEKYLFKSIFAQQLHTYVPRSDIRSNTVANMLMMPLDAEAGLWVLPADVDLNDYPQIQAHIDLLNVNQRVLQVTATKDMTAMPILQREGIEITLDTGRWLNYGDYENGSRVMVMHRQAALNMNVWLGDTVTLDIRDLLGPHWSMMIPADYDGWRDYPAVTVDFEIVGLYVYGASIFVHNDFYQTREVFIPDSAMPATFGLNAQPGRAEGYMGADTYSFVLDSPRYQAPFTAEYGEALAAAGFTLAFRDEAPGEFVAGVDSIIFSLTVNVWVFSAASSIVLILAVFLYMRQIKRNFVISRVLGCSAAAASRQSFVPAVIMWLPFGAAGAYGAWRFALVRAGETLHTLTAKATVIVDRSGAQIIHHAAELPYVWLAAMYAGIFVIIFAALLAGVVRISGIPVLELLQDVKAARKQRQTVILSNPPAATANPLIKRESTLLNLTFENQPNPKIAYKAEVRRIFRQILRSPLKTAVTAGTALAFVFAIGWLHHTLLSTRNDLDKLYQTTQVSVHIRLDSETLNEGASPDSDPPPLNLAMPFGNVINARLVNAFLANEFVDGSYIVAINDLLHITAANADGSFPYGRRGSFMRTVIYAHNDIEAFAADYGGVAVTYAHGFGAGDFAYEINRENPSPIPVIMCRERMEALGIGPGDTAYLTDTRRTSGRMYWLVHIIGGYEGTLTRNIPGGHEMLKGSLVMPLEGMQMMVTNISYTDAIFYLDKEMNGELPLFREFVAELFGVRQGAALVRPFFDDGDLRLAAEPLERNLVLLRILYPVTLVLSFVIGAGLTGLLAIQNAKVTAILRVLGATKRSARITVCAELLTVTAAGILLGLIILPIFNIMYNVLIFLMMLYLMGVLIGAAAGAAVISRRPPMELLQVKE